MTHQPLPFASVFLANTTYGATANEHGFYVLPNVALGRYDLSASYLGYQLCQRPVLVAATTDLIMDCGLLSAPQPLGEVVVRPANRPADYQLFLQLFLGTSSFARLCRVRDPGDISVVFDPNRRRLTARAPRALQVDNGALGYRLTCYDFDFQADITDDIVTITTISRVVFKSLPALNTDEQRRWETNRQKTYWGSYLHFFFAVPSGPARGRRVPATTAATHSQPPPRSCRQLGTPLAGRGAGLRQPARFGVAAPEAAQRIVAHSQAPAAAG